MTTGQNVTTATADEVKAQIRAWYAAGLPEGHIFIRGIERLAHIQMPDPNSVVAWAAALGVEDISCRHGVVSVGITSAVKPVSLPGWGLQVWCDAPVVQPEQRIEVSA